MPRTISGKTKRMLQVNKRNRWPTIQRSRLPHDQNVAGKCIHGMDWPQKDLCYDPANLDNRIFKNAQNIRQSHRIYQKRHEKVEKRISSWRINPNRNENPKWHPSWTLTHITILSMMPVLRGVSSWCNG